MQSYAPPAGVALARYANLGFSGAGGFHTDSAYIVGADPAFANFAHTASPATTQFFIVGEGNQDLNDESWAMDNLSVSVSTLASPVPEPESWLLLAIGAVVLAAASRRRRRAD